MKIIPKIIFLTIGCLPLMVHSQNYFPAHVGDTWEWYSNVNDSNYSTSITNLTEKADGSTDVYFNNSEKPKYNIKSNGNVYQYFSDNKLGIWYDFTVAPGDTFYTTLYSAEYSVIVDSVDGEIFGEQTQFRKFIWVSSFDPYSRSTQWLSDKIGLYSTESFLGPLSEYVIGCKINGKTYGSLVGIGNDESKLLYSFYLSQNYPNPFNPTTTIEYNLSNSCFVNITVYNLLGEKIETLVNEFKSTGTHKIIFDGKNLPSGIYFYKISSRDKSEIRKMQLLK